MYLKSFKANWLTGTRLGVTLPTNLLNSTCLDYFLGQFAKRYLFIKQCLNVPLPTDLLKEAYIYRPICCLSVPLQTNLLKDTW